MTETLRKLILGFTAAAIAVATVHQSIVYLLDASGLITREAWSMAPTGPFAVPTLLNAVFWGGLWGALLAIVYRWLPGPNPAIKGLLFGWMIYLFSNSLILPLIKGGPLFFGGQVNQMLAVFLILSGFGMTTALIYNAIAGRERGAA